MPIGEHAQEFVETFDYIVKKCDNNPNALQRIANEDPEVREAAEALSGLALSAGFEDDSKGKFARNVSESFLKRWSDFKDRWENECLKFDWLIGGLSAPNSELRTERMDSWEFSDSQAADSAGDIRDAISFASGQLEALASHSSEEEVYHEAIENGIKNLRRIFTAARLDIRQFLRRYDLLPFIHVPENVSKKHGTEIEFKSIYHYLRESQIAFAFGLDRAAYAMLRALLELVVTKHYGLDIHQTAGNKKPQLSAKLKHFRMKYENKDWFEPVFAQMNEIKEKGDLVLHFDKQSVFKAGEKKLFETHFASLFIAVKHLIQNAENEAKTASTK